MVWVEYLRRLSLVARLVFIPIAVVFIVLGVYGTVLGAMEGDGQTGLVLPLCAAYAVGTYFVVATIDKKVREWWRLRRKREGTGADARY